MYGNFGRLALMHALATSGLFSRADTPMKDADYSELEQRVPARQEIPTSPKAQPHTQIREAARRLRQMKKA